MLPRRRGRRENESNVIRLDAGRGGSRWRGRCDQWLGYFRSCCVEHQAVSDLIHVAALTGRDFDALRELARARGWPAVKEWMEPRDVLLLAELIKRAIDTNTSFPSGKWSVLEHLRRIFDGGFRG